MSYLRRINISLPEKCCCLQLRTAGIIIGSLWTIPLGLVCFQAGADLVVTVVHHSEALKDAITETAEEIERIEFFHDSITYQLCVVFSMSLVMFSTCILQIYGAVKQRRLFMLPFMTSLGSAISILLTGEIIRILLISTTVYDFFGTLLVSGVCIYQMILLFGYYKQLQEQRQPPNEGDVFDVIDAEL